MCFKNNYYFSLDENFQKPLIYSSRVIAINKRSAFAGYTG